MPQAPTVGAPILVTVRAEYWPPPVPLAVQMADRHSCTLLRTATNTHGPDGFAASAAFFARLATHLPSLFHRFSSLSFSARSAIFS